MKTHRNAAEAKLAAIAWKFKLIETSVKVTRTPGTTLKSLLLDMMKEEVPAQVAGIGNGLSLINAALTNPEPLVRNNPESLPNRIR